VRKKPVHTIDAAQLPDIEAIIAEMNSATHTVRLEPWSIEIPREEVPLAIKYLRLGAAHRNLVMSRKLRASWDMDRAAGGRKGRGKLLTDVQCLEIAQRVGKGESMNRLAKEYGVGWGTIRAAFNRVRRVGSEEGAK
jgi:hypothetical protein